MGGFFSAPKASDPLPMPELTNSVEEEAQKQRLETMSRNRRGRSGLTATSERGLLTPVSGEAKRLLGE